MTYLIWPGLILGCLLWVIVPASAATDITPPRITVIAPLNESQVDTGTPRIEVSFGDTLSGINQQTIHLFVDRVEVTAGSVIEQEDPTGQDAASPWRISYLSKASLSKGKHQVRFSVEDRAGNLGELGWSFEVIVGGEGRFNINGSNSLNIDISPVKKAADSLELNAEGAYRETAVRLNLNGKVTDYAGPDPDYRYHEYNFYSDDYSLGFYRRQATAVFGYVNASLDSELLQIGLRMYGNGGIVGDTLNKVGGQYQWDVFSGDSGSSYGTSAAVYRMTGASGTWYAKSGWQLGSYYVGLDGDDNQVYDFYGFKGSTFMKNWGLFRYELLHGSTATGAASGNRGIVHWDRSLTGWDLGLDYMLSQSDYPDIGSAGLFASANGGMRSYEFRATTIIRQFHNLSFDGTISRDNLDHSSSYTVIRRDITAGYGYHPGSGFGLNADYNGSFRHSEGSSNDRKKVDQTLSLALQQKIGLSQFKVNCTLNSVSAPNPDDTFDQVQLLSSWTYPRGACNITPSLEWSNQKSADSDCDKAMEARLTWSRKLSADLTRSSIAIFCRVSDQLDDGETTRVTKFGLLPELYLLLGSHSKLTLVYDYYNWTRKESAREDQDGVDKRVSLKWEVNF